MKRILFAAIILLQLVSCKKKETTVINGYDTKGATLLSQATFVSNKHTTSGNLKLYEKSGVKSLVFDSFKTDSGPDLRVYASKDLNNKDFVEIGKLQATSGNFNYPISSTLNTNDYKYIIIWCEDYSVLFGNAQLK